MHLATDWPLIVRTYMTTLSRPPARILVIEDEIDLRDATVDYLNMEGFQAFGLGSLSAAKDWIKTYHCDLLVLDLGLPDGDGLKWLNDQVSISDMGIIITTARGSAGQRIDGIRAGADVYLVKPIQLAELSSLATNLVRRLSTKSSRSWTLRKLLWILETPQGIEVKLTHSETVLLARLALTPGQAVHRRDLVTSLGLDPETYDFRRMEILVRRMRNKIKQHLGFELPIETVHKLGYAFTAPIEVS